MSQRQFNCGPTGATVVHQYANCTLGGLITIPAAPIDAYGRNKILASISVNIPSIQISWNQFPSGDISKSATYSINKPVLLIQNTGYYVGENPNDIKYQQIGAAYEYAGTGINTSGETLSNIPLTFTGTGGLSEGEILWIDVPLHVSFGWNMVYNQYWDVLFDFADITNIQFTWEELPPPPLAFSLNSPVMGTTGVNISWSASTNATSYKIYRADGVHASKATGTWTNIQTVASLSYYDEGITIGNTYSYYVKALNNYGEVESNFVNITTSPPAPIIQYEPQYVLDSENVKLSWTETSPVDSYKVFRADGYETDTESVNFSEIADVTTLYAEDSTAVLGETYSYFIRALNGGLYVDSNIQYLTVNKQQQQIL